MTFAQFLVTSLIGLVVYAIGFHRGLKTGAAAKLFYPNHVGKADGRGRCDCSDCWCRYV